MNSTTGQDSKGGHAFSGGGRRVLACVVFAMVACFPLAVRAQSAPAGNAHPEAPKLSDVGEIVNPFGNPEPFSAATEASIATIEEKSAFAASLRLDSLRGLAVFHNGRVMILDTLARETIGTLVGRKDYFDTVSSGKKRRYDPLFTLLDLMIDPAYYINKPVLYINYLPLRRAFVEMAFPDNTGDAQIDSDNRVRRDLYMTLQRVTPAMVGQSFRAIVEQHGMEPGFQQGMSVLNDNMGLWRSSYSNLLVIAPESRDKPWQHLSQLDSMNPLRRAAMDLGAAWRARDSEAANAAIADLANLIPGVNAAQYPGDKLKLERAYNKVNAFEWGFWAYFCSLLAFLLGFGTGRPWLRNLGMAILIGAIGLHAFGFISRCLIAERFAIQNQFESMTGLSLFAALVGLAMTIVRRQTIFGAAAAGVGFLVLITATQTAIPGETIGREAAILNTSVLLKYHVTTVLVSYGLIALGMIVSLFYLGTHYFAGGNAPGAVVADGAIAATALGVEEAGGHAKAKLLSDLDSAQMIVLQLAFWTLGVGILLGAWWADHSWGRWWAFDPKETWALVTWIIYLIVIHVRLTTGARKGLVTAWLSVVGFIVMLWTYFGVNLLLPGLHAYA